MRNILRMAGGCCGGWIKLWTTYREAKCKWIAAGRPVRSAEETAYLYQLCKGCVNISNDRTVCMSCGCPVRPNNTRPKANKIAMATEHCPVGKW